MTTQANRSRITWTKQQLLDEETKVVDYWRESGTSKGTEKLKNERCSYFKYWGKTTFIKDQSHVHGERPPISFRGFAMKRLIEKMKGESRTQCLENERWSNEDIKCNEHFWRNLTMRLNKRDWRENTEFEGDFVVLLFTSLYNLVAIMLYNLHSDSDDFCLFHGKLFHECSLWSTRQTEKSKNNQYQYFATSGKVLQNRCLFLVSSYYYVWVSTVFFE